MERPGKPLFRFAAAVGGAVLFAAVSGAAATAPAATLDKIRESGSLTLGIRDDAAPFSSIDQNGKAAGYSISLCDAIADFVRETLDMNGLAIEFVTVSTDDRFDALADGRIDLLCGATTLTLGRREVVDFSLPTFATGSSVLYRAGGPASFTELVGQKVGVRGGTTTDDGLKRALGEAGIEAEVVPVDSHEAGLAALEQGDIAAYFADRAILVMLARQSQSPELLVISRRFFSFEPYALAMRRGDSAFRLMVDRALVRIYSGPAISNIYQAHFGKAKMSDLLRALYTLQRLQE